MNAPPLTVGLTGGIACGKSEVARMFAARGVPVLDLDAVARRVVAPGAPALAEIAARWPEAVVDGALDRKALGAVVFASTERRRTLEAILHPRIWAYAEDWLAAQRAAGAPLVVVEAALMVETGSYTRYDRLVVVSAAPDTQRARVMARDGLDAAAADARIAAQLPLADKERVAHAIVRNDGDRAALERRFDELWDELWEWVGRGAPAAGRPSDAQ